MRLKNDNAPMMNDCGCLSTGQNAYKRFIRMIATLGKLGD